MKLRKTLATMVLLAFAWTAAGQDTIDDVTGRYSLVMFSGDSVSYRGSLEISSPSTKEVTGVATIEGEVRCATVAGVFDPEAATWVLDIAQGSSPYGFRAFLSLLPSSDSQATLIASGQWTLFGGWVGGDLLEVGAFEARRLPESADTAARCNPPQEGEQQ